MSSRDKYDREIEERDPIQSDINRGMMFLAVLFCILIMAFIYMLVKSW